MTSELRDKILAADDLGREVVHVDEWDMDVTVRGMTAGEVEAFGAEVTNGKMPQVMARLACLVIVDEDGQRVFSDEDADALGRKNPVAIRTVFMAAQRVSGLMDDGALTKD